MSLLRLTHIPEYQERLTAFVGLWVGTGSLLINDLLVNIVKKLKIFICGFAKRTASQVSNGSSVFASVL